MEEPLRPRLLLLLPTLTYRADEFVDAAKRLGFELTVASEVPSALEAQHPSELITLNFDDPESAVAGCKAFAAQYPISAVIGPDDATALLAAMMSQELGLPSNPVAAVQAARSKILQRELLRDGGIPVPDFRVFELSEDPVDIASSVSFPCVVKPTAMSASRGVIRANDPEEFVAAHARLRSILESAAGAAGASDRYIVERYIPGAEFAIEGLIVNGGLHILAIFDKPDPLEGPFFEETIYVTPSRAEPGVQNSLVDTAGRAAGTLGLTTGPLHAELRYNEDGPWVVELAARPIGGKCGRVLRFGETGERSLEDVVVAHAAGMLDDVPRRESCAAGVMMIPIPSAGVLERVGGVDAARRVPGVDEVLITAHRGQELVPLPEGSRYLGFIFARGETPELAEEALRRAHGALEIDVRRGTATPPHPKGGRVGPSHVSRLIEEGL